MPPHAKGLPDRAPLAEGRANGKVQGVEERSALDGAGALHLAVARSSSGAMTTTGACSGVCAAVASNRPRIGGIGISADG